MRVLVVDRDEEARRSAIDALVELTNVTLGGAAVDVRAALSALAFNRIDVVVTDFELDDGDALDIIDAARRLDPSPAIVVYPAVAFATQERRCLAAGADLYLPRTAGVGRLQDGVLAMATLRRRGRRITPPGDPIDLGQLVERVIGELGRIVSDAVPVPCNVEPGLLPVRGITVEIERLIMDLVMDAIALRPANIAVRIKAGTSRTVRVEVLGGQGVVLGGADLPVWSNTD